MARREALAESRCGNDTYTYTVRHGEEQGVVLRPHLYSDGFFVVSMTRFARDQIKVPRHEPLRGWLQKGYSVRMSAPGVSPRLISPASVEGFDG
jgi:hypothetical protein